MTLQGCPPSVYDWESKTSYILTNCATASEEKLLISKLLPTTGPFSAHFWLATSGTTTQESAKKWVALSKEALLASALAVNKHINSYSSDIWLHALPSFHVGGLGIWCRAFLSKAKVHSLQGKWNASHFCERCNETKATLSALVPTQIYDLVTHKCSSPSSLRAVIVGGAALSASLEEQAKKLGWPLLPSYGLTECASQVATALPSMDSSEFPYKILDHVSLKVDDDGSIAIKSAALLTAHALVNNNSFEIIDPKKEGWFHSQDRGLIKNEYLKWTGRTNEVVKITGEPVDLCQLDALLRQLQHSLEITNMASLFAKKDERLGMALYLAIENCSELEAQKLMQAFNAQVLPFERIRGYRSLPCLPKNDLGKILRNKLS